MKAHTQFIKVIGLFLICGLVTAEAGMNCRARTRHGQVRDRLGNQCKHGADRFNCIDVLEVTDGDTLNISIQGIHPYFAEDTSVRIFGLDTPESRPSTVKCLELPESPTQKDREEYEVCLEALRLRECEVKASKTATKLLEEAICDDGDRIDILLAKDGKGELIREKYGRILGNISIVEYSGQKEKRTDAGKLLLEKQLAFSYDGGTKLKRDWCNKNIVRNPKLQESYIKEHFCSSRKCTEKTYQERCYRRRGYNGKIGCYNERVESNIGRWFSSCGTKEGKERRDCYQDKAEDYLAYCRLFDTSAEGKKCRADLGETITNYCEDQKGSAQDDCLSVL